MNKLHFHFTVDSEPHNTVARKVKAECEGWELFDVLKYIKQLAKDNGCELTQVIVFDGNTATVFNVYQHGWNSFPLPVIFSDEYTDVTWVGDPLPQGFSVCRFKDYNSSSSKYYRLDGEYPNYTVVKTSWLDGCGDDSGVTHYRDSGGTWVETCRGKRFPIICSGLNESEAIADFHASYHSWVLNNEEEGDSLREFGAIHEAGDDSLD